MRRRILLLAAAATILAGAGVAASMLRPQPAPPPDPRPQPALPVLIANYRLADRIELVQGAHILWLERRGQIWGLAEAGGYPVRPDAAASLIDGLMALTLDHPVANPGGDGTLVRVLAVSGGVLGAVVIGPADGLVRRPGLPGAWQAEPQLRLSANPDDWIDTALPAPDVARLTGPGSTEADITTLRRSLAALHFTAVRASPQIHPVPVRSIPLALPDGTATLELGRLAGQDWLHVSGSSAWARSLSPYAFAVPAGTL